MTSALRGSGLAEKQTMVLVGFLSVKVTREGESKNPNKLRTSYINGP